MKYIDHLMDIHRRKLTYLRISVGEACQFKCVYCLPKGFQGKSVKEPELSLFEIENLISAFADLGISKVRITGGEPSLRRDLVELISMISSTRGIKKVALTTNGFNLIHRLDLLYKSGLRYINISMDSLREETFHRITGINGLESVKNVVEQSFLQEFSSVKINTVLLKDINDDEVDHFLEWIRGRPVTLRWIELMQTHDNQDFFTKHFLSSDFVKRRLRELNWSPISKMIQRNYQAGPAQEFIHPEYMGKIGIISPYSENFCLSCNRLRVSSYGRLKLCLFGKGDLNLRPLLKERSMKDELKEVIQKALNYKPEFHHLNENDWGNTSSLSQLGG